MILTIDDTFSKNQKNVINEILENAKNQFNLTNKILVLDIKNCNRLKTTAGNAKSNIVNKTGIVSLNKRLFNSTAGINEFKDTFIHELSHIIANLLTGKRCGHDSYWKAIDLKLGGNNKVYHTYEVDHLKPVVKRFEYKCNCRVHKLTVNKHNKILNGAKFICTLCKNRIELKL